MQINQNCNKNWTLFFYSQWAPQTSSSHFSITSIFDKLLFFSGVRVDFEKRLLTLSESRETFFCVNITIGIIFLWDLCKTNAIYKHAVRLSFTMMQQCWQCCYDGQASQFLTIIDYLIGFYKNPEKIIILLRKNASFYGLHNTVLSKLHFISFSSEHYSSLRR